MKLNNSNIVTTRYGGVIPIIEEMIKREIPDLIDSSMNEILPRANQSVYKYSDMFITWIVSAMCGAIRIDNVTNLKEELNVIPGKSTKSRYDWQTDEESCGSKYFKR